MAGRVLHSILGLDFLDPLLLSDIFGNVTTGSEDAALAESPDHAGNPPGQAAALEAAEYGKAAGDTEHEHHGNFSATGVDETPCEPDQEEVVNWVEVSDHCTRRLGVPLFLQLHVLDVADLTVPAVTVGVHESEET